MGKIVSKADVIDSRGVISQKMERTIHIICTGFLTVIDSFEINDKNAKT